MRRQVVFECSPGGARWATDTMRPGLPAHCTWTCGYGVSDCPLLYALCIRRRWGAWSPRARKRSVPSDRVRDHEAQPGSANLTAIGIGAPPPSRLMKPPIACTRTGKGPLPTRTRVLQAQVLHLLMVRPLQARRHFALRPVPTRGRVAEACAGLLRLHHLPLSRCSFGGLAGLFGGLAGCLVPCPGPTLFVPELKRDSKHESVKQEAASEKVPTLDDSPALWARTRWCAPEVAPKRPFRHQLAARWARYTSLRVRGLADGQAPSLPDRGASVARRFGLAPQWFRFRRTLAPTAPRPRIASA